MIKITPRCMAPPFLAKFRSSKKRMLVNDSNIIGDLNLGEDFQEASNFELKCMASNLVGNNFTINHIHSPEKVNTKLEEIVENVIVKHVLREHPSIYEQLTNVKKAAQMDPNVANKILSLDKLATILEKSGYIGDGKIIRIDLAKMKINTDSPAIQIEGYQQLCGFDPSSDWFDCLRKALILVNHHEIYRYEFHIKNQILRYICEGRPSTNGSEIPSFTKKLVLEASNVPRNILDKNPSARRFHKSAEELYKKKKVKLSKEEKNKLFAYTEYRQNRQNVKKNVKESMRALMLSIAIWGTSLAFLGWLGSLF